MFPSVASILIGRNILPIGMSVALLILSVLYWLESRENTRLVTDLARCEMNFVNCAHRMKLQSKFLDERCQHVHEYYQSIPQRPGNGVTYLPDNNGVLITPEPGTSAYPENARVPRDPVDLSAPTEFGNSQRDPPKEVPGTPERDERIHDRP